MAGLLAPDGEQIDQNTVGRLIASQDPSTMAPSSRQARHLMTGNEILNMNDPFRSFIKNLTLGLSAMAGGAGLLGAPGTNAAVASGGIGGSGSIIGGQFVPAGGFVSDAALAGLPAAAGTAGTVSSGLGGSAAFLGGGGLSTSGTTAAAINADILAGGTGSIGGGAVGSSIPGAGGEGAFGLTQSFGSATAGSSLLDKIQQGTDILDTINGLGGREIGVSLGGSGSPGSMGGNPLLFPDKVRDVSKGNTIESLIGKPESRNKALASQVRAQDSGAFGQTQEFKNPTDSGIIESLQEPGNKTGFGGFFDNLDQNMQSPAKLLGLGLLSKIDPRLAQLGLLGGGIFGQNKLF